MAWNEAAREASAAKRKANAHHKDMDATSQTAAVHEGIKPKGTTNKEMAQLYNPEWMKLGNKILRAPPSSPRQKELQRQRDLLPKYRDAQTIKGKA